MSTVITFIFSFYINHHQLRTKKQFRIYRTG